MTKPVFKNLQNEVSSFSSSGPIFEYDTFDFKNQTFDSNYRLEEVKAPKMFRTKQHMQRLNDFLNSYDVSRVKEQRVLRCFTIGRSLQDKELNDKTIDKDLENIKNGFKIKVTPFKNFPSSRNSPVAEKSQLFTKVLQSPCLDGRTDKFYQTLGGQLADRDASNEYLFKYNDGNSR